MADLLPRPDLTQFTAFRKGDEQALTDIYRTGYDAMLAQSKEVLGPDLQHFGGRVAQQAMLSVWRRHESYEDVNGFTSSLEEAVREESQLQRRKHAALNHGAKTALHGVSKGAHLAVPTADQAVEQLMAELHAAPIDHAKTVAETLEARKHQAAAHVQNVGSKKSWLKPAAVVLVLGAGIVALMRWLGASSEEVAATKAIAAENARVVSAAKGQRGKVSLDDATKLLIGSDSKVRAPNDFGVLVRTLELTGTANFNVAPGGKLPFVVRAQNAVITATGTSFTVRAFPVDSAVTVAVDEGSVSVRAKGEKTETAVPAGKTLRMAKDGTVSMLDDAQHDIVTAWTRDSLVFTEVPMSVALPELVRWFDLKAKLADAALNERKVSLRIGLQSSGEALKAVAAAGNMMIAFEKGDVMVLKDDPKAAAKAAAKKK